MNFIRNREELEHLLVAMHGEGWSIRGMAKHFSIGRNTVRRVLRKYADRREPIIIAAPLPVSVDGQKRRGKSRGNFNILRKIYWVVVSSGILTT